jgi:galactokinase
MGAMAEPQAILGPQALRNSFRKLYGKEPRIFSAPGRVNLIGEHTDYNEGFVLPMAADRRTYVAAALRDDKHVSVYSFNLEEAGEFELDNNTSPTPKRWLAYIEGVTRLLLEKGISLKGADIAISSEVPIGAGLSSSAALEISTGYALLKLADTNVELMQLALAAQEAEHLFVGTRSGLMDQLTATFAVKDHALFIDCRSLERKATPVNLPAMAVVVCDTRVKHELATSAYNERRHECERAVEILRKMKPNIRSLRDVSINDLERYGELLPETIRRRTRHVVTENERTLLAAAALPNGDADRLGQLMNESHESLRIDYEVSCPELDLMVALARQQEGVAGARMMGGGFGGSTVNLVRRDKFESFHRFVSEGYERATGLVPNVISVEADKGVCELQF